MITVYRGAQAPEVIAITITRGKTDLNLDQVAQVSFVVRSASGSESTWNATINEGRSPSQLTATHVFASDGSDVKSVGVFRIMPNLQLSAGGVRCCIPFSLQVLE